MKDLQQHAKNVNGQKQKSRGLPGSQAFNRPIDLKGQSAIINHSKRFNKSLATVSDQIRIMLNRGGGGGGGGNC